MIRITIDDEEVTREVIAEFLALPKQIRHIHNLLGRVAEAEQQESLDIAALIAKVDAETSIDNSIKALIEGLGEINSPAIQALTAKLKESGDALAAAVQANTV